MLTRQKISSILKNLIIVSAFLSTVFGFLTATRDGYSHWTSRLLYFTTQSNIWIGIIYLCILVLSKTNPNKRLQESFHHCKFIFVVCILMTGFVFCLFLAPFADQSYHPWSIYSIMAHVITPILALLDFYLDEYVYDFHFSHIISVIIPPLIYYALAIALGYFNLNFGRGEPYPYFFLKLNSQAGIFGFSINSLQIFGTFWWLLFFSLVMISIGFILIKTHPKMLLKRKSDSA